ncbi:serine hydrolase domain-containing protein [Flavivirga spongiicola]|uniref:Beta-lactamase n=1 Tax=Flavivirga spongiicola TaxID=421621 RepID=A0ABU7XVK5_9FLAO|nr:serine hydrolase domain-containing protein [Flavivirga sp. MEBiC05379]MDO5978960.1 serine hydrolase domain-containing protein [Flavivirga sp. MEBiC05379]
MKKYLTALIGIILSGGLNGQVKNASHGLESLSVQITNEQSDLIFEQTKPFPNSTELSIAIIDKGKVTFIGIKRINDTIKVSENYQSVFEIGSISKVFTATLLSNFALEKKLNLEDAIQDYSNFTIKVSDKITFKELANHTSGLPRLPSNLNLFSIDKDNPYKEYDSKKLIAYLTEKIKLKQKPGIKYEYSNLGAGVLSFELAEISKSTYEALLQEKIFRRYGMSNSTTKRDHIKNKLVPGLNPKGEITSNWDFKVLEGGGAILSSTEDLSKFALAQFDKKNKELILTQKPTFKVNENMSLGLGWHILSRKNESEFLWHNGGTGGYTSSMVLNIKNKNGIIILSNVSAFNKKMGHIDQLCFKLIKTLGYK